jgi:hypothetical protein
MLSEEIASVITDVDKDASPPKAVTVGVPTKVKTDPVDIADPKISQTYAAFPEFCPAVNQPQKKIKLRPGTLNPPKVVLLLKSE